MSLRFDKVEACTPLYLLDGECAVRFASVIFDTGTDLIDLHPAISTQRLSRRQPSLVELNDSSSLKMAMPSGTKETKRLGNLALVQPWPTWLNARAPFFPLMKRNKKAPAKHAPLEWPVGPLVIHKRTLGIYNCTDLTGRISVKNAMSNHLPSKKKARLYPSVLDKPCHTSAALSDLVELTAIKEIGSESSHLKFDWYQRSFSVHHDHLVEIEAYRIQLRAK